MENKQEILDLLLEAMQATRDMYDLVVLEYNEVPDADVAFVDAVFASGGKRRINVTGDSGIAMMRDVLKHIDG